MKEFAEDNFKFDENGKKLSKMLENIVGKGEFADYKPHKNKGLFGKGLKKQMEKKKMLVHCNENVPDFAHIISQLQEKSPGISHVKIVISKSFQTQQVQDFIIYLHNYVILIHELASGKWMISAFQ